MALLRRIWIATILVNLVVLIIFVGLSALQFGNINSGLVGDRLGVLAERTAAPFEAAAKIGLPLSTVRNAKALLERARQFDEEIINILVFDASGAVVHSTSVEAPARISAEAMVTRNAAQGEPWYKETKEGFLSSIDIVSSKGATAGGIMIVYPRGGSFTRVLAMTAELAFVAILTLALSTLAGYFLFRFALRPQLLQFESIEENITNFEKAAWRHAAGQGWDNSLHSKHDANMELYELLMHTEDNYDTIGKSLATERGSEK
ncbi:hypothetical protein A9Q83_10900 [Alphaproteobacteria bacterium 46_93_T64]|nr:hypothetical protein A9Q83_10900 [Alphaproteobacteria bacterium 46_93_T64]